MLKKENIKKGLITTLIGIAFLIADFALFLYPFFKNEYEISSSVLIAGAVIGGILIYSPDKIIGLKDKL
jgi:hypothetical protein